MTDVRPLTIAELRTLVTDGAELAKGTEIADKGGLLHLSRHENKLFADAQGSGAQPYKTQIHFGDAKVTGRCSCMAARSRPFCKHAAALLVSWARTPEAFVVAEGPPPAAPGSPGTKRATVKKGKVDREALLKKGVTQAETLLHELFQTGVSTIADDRAAQVAELATQLREAGLRRLSARTLELSALLARAAERDGSFAHDDYAELVSDMWLTVKKLEKHLAGEPLQPEHVEELVGKTWTKKDRTPIEGLRLVEVKFSQRTTPDGFLVRESRLFDLGSGEHFVERQIVPAALAKRIPPKPSHRGVVLEGATASVFPSFAPRRLDVEGATSRPTLRSSHVTEMLAHRVPSVSKAHALLAERRKDPFAPAEIPVLLAVDWVLPGHGRVRLVDETGGALFVAGGREAEEELTTALARGRCVALFGDVALDGALPSLFPVAVVVEREGVPELLPLGGDGASARTPDEARGPKWSDVAKKTGVSHAATLLGEVRDDLAELFHDGAPAVTERRVGPLASRLAELSLAKQADALRALPAASDATTVLDGLARLQTVLGIALTRLASTAPIDASRLVRIPSMPSAAIERPGETLSPDEARKREAMGAITRWERAYHVAKHYEGVSKEELVRDVERHWGDGFAAPFVIAAARDERKVAVELAVSALAQGRSKSHWSRASSRITKLTAIAILAEAKDLGGHVLLAEAAQKEPDRTIAQRAARGTGTTPWSAAKLEELTRDLASASSAFERGSAAEQLASLAAWEAVPALRASLRDRAGTVRRAAAYALALLGDTDSLDTFASWLESGDHETAKAGAWAIGTLGDSRGTGVLLGALARGFSPSVTRESLERMGSFVLGPLLDLAREQPELAKRAAVASLVQSFEDAPAVIVAWLAKPGDPAEKATVALDAASKRIAVCQEIEAWLRREHPELLDGPSKLAKLVARRVAPPRPRKAT